MCRNIASFRETILVLFTIMLHEFGKHFLSYLRWCFMKKKLTGWNCKGLKVFELSKVSKVSKTIFSTLWEVGRMYESKVALHTCLYAPFDNMLLNIIPVICSSWFCRIMVWQHRTNWNWNTRYGRCRLNTGSTVSGGWVHLWPFGCGVGMRQMAVLAACGSVFHRKHCRSEEKDQYWIIIIIIHSRLRINYHEPLG